MVVLTIIENLNIELISAQLRVLTYDNKERSEEIQGTFKI